MKWSQDYLASLVLCLQMRLMPQAGALSCIRVAVPSSRKSSTGVPGFVPRFFRV